MRNKKKEKMAILLAIRTVILTVTMKLAMYNISGV
jgi:hypothetical protein